MQRVGQGDGSWEMLVRQERLQGQDRRDYRTYDNCTGYGEMLVVGDTGYRFQ